MRPQKVQNEELLEALLATIRSKGYDGASMKDLENVSGLKKASLYHRFPKGKKEIAQRVMNFVAAWLAENVINILKDSSKKPKTRLSTALENINTFYKGGKETCLFRALSLDNSFELFQNELQLGMNKWIEAFQQLAIDLGFTEKLAKEKATHTIVLIQGSLLVSKVLQDNSTFTKTLDSIKSIYK